MRKSRRARQQSSEGWVFTTAEEVVYMYRPNREGGLLPRLVKYFRGVWASDFYAAYDALPCPSRSA